MIVPKKNVTWQRSLLQVKGTILEDIKWRLIFVVGNALIVTLLHEIFDADGQWLSMTPFSLVGLALGIFLGFRNNTSYDRFWEGRKLWGGVVNTSRTITRRILTLVDQEDETRLSLYVHQVAAYVHMLRMHLRGEWQPQEVEHLLSAEEIASLQSEGNRPIAMLQKLGDELRTEYKAGNIHPQHVPLLEGALTDFTNLQGGCERIKSTPIPFSYNILLHRIVAIYCFALPFGLVPLLHGVTPIVVALIGYAFLGIDALGDEIEEPFGHDDNDLPLLSISTMIEHNVRQRIGDADLPELKYPNPITRVLN